MSKNMFDSVVVKKTSNYPYETSTKKKYFVELQDDSGTYVEGFDTKKEAVDYADRVKTQYRGNY